MQPIIESFFVVIGSTLFLSSLRTSFFFALAFQEIETGYFENGPKCEEGIKDKGAVAHLLFANNKEELRFNSLQLPGAPDWLDMQANCFRGIIIHYAEL